MTKKSVCRPPYLQEPYIIWLSFEVHKCKMMISLVFFFFFHFFKILIFQVVRGLKGQKMVQNEKELCVSYLRNHASYKCNFCYTWVKWWHLQMYFLFSKFWLCRLLVFCFIPYLRNCALIWLWFLILIF